jgi:hypothetical protein
MSTNAERPKVKMSQWSIKEYENSFIDRMFKKKEFSPEKLPILSMERAKQDENSESDIMSELMKSSKLVHLNSRLSS